MPTKQEKKKAAPKRPTRKAQPKQALFVDRKSKTVHVGPAK